MLVTKKRCNVFANLNDIQNSILLTLAYGMVFNYPLSKTQCYNRLIKTKCSFKDFEYNLKLLESKYIKIINNIIIFNGNIDLIKTRQNRFKLSQIYWKKVYKYAGFLYLLPFVELVCVSGSIAHNNPVSANKVPADIDFFLVVKKDRVFFVKVLVASLIKLINFFLEYKICANYIVDDYHISSQNIYTATEVVSCKPIYNYNNYKKFINANLWVKSLFPNLIINNKVYCKEFSNIKIKTFFENIINLKPNLYYKLCSFIYYCKNLCSKKKSFSLFVSRLPNSYNFQIYCKYQSIVKAIDSEYFDIANFNQLYGEIDREDINPSNLNLNKFNNNSYYKSICDYYNKDAIDFEARYYKNPILQKIRSEFRKHVDQYSFNNALEIGFGTGFDLLYFAKKYPQRNFFGIDISNKMVDITKSKIAENNIDNISIEWGSQDNIKNLWPNETFDMIYVFFGALNTTEDLKKAMQILKNVSNNNTTYVLTFVNKYYLNNIFFNLMLGRFSTAFKRLKSTWSGYSNKKVISSKCYSAYYISKIIKNDFVIEKKYGYSIVFPAWFMLGVYKKLKGITNVLWNIDKCLNKTFFWQFGEYNLFVLKNKQ